MLFRSGFPAEIDEAELYRFCLVLVKETRMGFRPLRRVKFLFTAPFIVAMLFVINLVTSPGHWWVQWAALGLGIAWVINLLKVFRTVALVGGLTAIAAYFAGRRT